MSRFALVVDNSSLIRGVVSRFLEQRGFEVEAAMNGWDAIHLMERRVPELVVTDLQMPRMSGQEFIHHIRHRAETSKATIVVVAGRKGSLAAVTGADYVIYKDVDLVEQLQMTLDKFTPSRAVNTSNKKPGEIAG